MQYLQNIFILTIIYYKVGQAVVLGHLSLNMYLCVPRPTPHTRGIGTKTTASRQNKNHKLSPLALTVLSTDGSRGRVHVGGGSLVTGIRFILCARHKCLNGVRTNTTCVLHPCRSSLTTGQYRAHCKDKMPKIWNKYSQKKNIGAQSRFPHSCVCERIIYSHDGPAYFAAGNMWTNPGTI